MKVEDSHHPSLKAERSVLYLLLSLLSRRSDSGSTQACQCAGGFTERTEAP